MGGGPEGFSCGMEPFQQLIRKRRRDLKVFAPSLQIETCNPTQLEHQPLAGLLGAIWRFPESFWKCC